MKRNDELSGLGCVGALVFAVAVMVIGSIANGYALVQLWEWFVRPTFESAPTLSIPAAIGLSMVVGYMTSEGYTDPENKNRSLGEKLAIVLVTAIARPGLILMFGYVVAQFMP